MPFQLLDIVLIAIMLVSGVLALMRGFTREVLSLVAWGAAAVAAYFAIRSPELLGFAGKYLQPDIVAKIAVGAGTFLIILIIVSLISVKLSDAVVDSPAGAFDRLLGFVYGLARGLVLVVIAYLFYGWLIPVDRQEPWVRNAQSLPLIKSVGQMILSLVPPDIAETLTNAAILDNQPSGTTSVTVQPDSEEGAAPDEEGYKKSDSKSMDQLIQGTQGQQQQPTFGGQDNTQ
jgi:membrane protein required for colicin V production